MRGGNMCYDGEHLFPRPRKFGPWHWEVNWCDKRHVWHHNEGIAMTKAGARVKVNKFRAKHHEFK